MLGDLSPGIKLLRHEDDHAPPSGAEVKNASSYVSRPTQDCVGCRLTTSLLIITSLLFLSHNTVLCLIFKA